jgi:N6-adenosine-specific RNA methylase IME4
MAVEAYRCIEMDCPWPEFGGGRITRGAQKHYELIKTKEEILEVVLRARFADGQFVFQPHPGGCHLWMWATSNYLPWALWLIEALGFKYKKDFIWIKSAQVRNDAGEPTDYYKLQRPGLGQYGMSQHELLLFGTKGKAMKPATGDRPRTALLAPRPTDSDGKMIHSAKPPEAMEMIEKVSPGPRLEMFARTQRAGWDCWGNEV